MSVAPRSLLRLVSALCLVLAMSWAVPLGASASETGYAAAASSSHIAARNYQPEPRSSFRSVGELATTETHVPGWGVQMTLIASKWDQIGILIIGGLLLGWLHYIRRKRV